MVDIAAAFYPTHEGPEVLWVFAEPMEDSIYANGVKKALTRADALGICPHRLWNLAANSDFGQFDLVSLVHLLDRSVHQAHFQQGSHDNCTAGYCQLLDDNSTTREQLHVCHDSACETSRFPSSVLEKDSCSI